MPDRFLLYTDGLTEPESATGEPFGDSRLEQVLLGCPSRPAEELRARLLAAVTAWSPASIPQQDDITFLVIWEVADLMGSACGRTHARRDHRVACLVVV